MLEQVYLDSFSKIVGTSNVHIKPEEKLIVSTPYRDGEGQLNFLAIIDPKNVNEIAAIVSYCAQENIAIVTQGGLTSLTKASIPNPNLISRQQIILRMHRMNKMLEIISNTENIPIAVKTQPGITLHALNEELKPYHVEVPIGLGIGFKAQMGGIVSTNAGGTEAAFRGRPDSLVCALEVVTADGKIWNLPDADNQAPSLADFIGQEGTTGIITNITITVVPIMVKRKVAFVETDTIQYMHELLNIIKKHAAKYLNAFERIDNNVLNLMCHYFNKPDPFIKYRNDNKQAKYNILIELVSDNEKINLTEFINNIIKEAKNDDYVQTVWIGKTEEEANDIWSYRQVKLTESLQLRTKEIQGKIVAFDIGLAAGDHADFPSLSLENKLKQLIPGIELYGFGHAAGGGAGGTYLHFDPIVPKDTSEEQIAALKKAIYEEISYRGGTISAEHGIGFYLTQAFKQYNHAAYSERLIRKQRLDPHNLLNPGKVIAIEDVMK